MLGLANSNTRMDADANPSASDRVSLALAELEAETRCPICFGRLKNPRVSVVCLHRYCAECIEHCLRLEIPGRPPERKECPVCRAHLHSYRATRPDWRFEMVIKALYGDVRTYDAEESALLASSSLPPAASPTAAGSSAAHTSSPAAAHQGNNQNHGAGSHPASHQDHHTHGPQRHTQQHAGHSGSGHVAHAATGHAPSHSHGRGSNHHSTSAGRGQAQPSQTASPSRKHSAHTHQGGASEQEGVGISLHARQSFDIHSQLDVVPKLAPKLSDAVDMAISPVASPKAQQNPPGTLNGSLNARQPDCNASSGGAAQQQRLWLPEPMSKRRRVFTSTRLGRVTFASFGSLVESQTEVAGPSVYEALSPVSSKVCVNESPGLNLSGLSRLSLVSPKRKGAKYLCASRLSVQQAAPTSACEARLEVENSPACNSHHAAACGVATSPSPSPRQSRPYIQGFQYIPFTNPELQPPTPTAVACVPAPRQPQGMCHVRAGLLRPLVDGLRRDSGSSCSSRSQSMSPSQPAPFARLHLPVRQAPHTQGAQVLHAPQPSSAAAASTTSTAHILRVPSACSAAGLGMRHPGMVLVHLRPADDPPPSTTVTSSLRAPSPMPGKHADMDRASNPSMQCMSSTGGICCSHLHSFPSSGQDTASLVVQGAVARPGCSVQGSFERDVPCSGGYKNLPALGKPFCLVPTKWTVTQLKLLTAQCLASHPGRQQTHGSHPAALQASLLLGQGLVLCAEVGMLQPGALGARGEALRGATLMSMLQADMQDSGRPLVITYSAVGH